METLIQQKMKVNTPLLQDMVSKSVKACSMEDSFPVTSLFEITAKDGVLTITSTDNVNILKLTRSGVEGDIDVVVDAKLFSALISRLSTPITEICVEGNNIVVKANGKYDMPIIVEEDGSKVSLPTYNFDETVAGNSVTTLELKTILSMNKSCKAEMKEMPSLFNYYMDSERVLTTDFYKACDNPVKMFNNPVCLPPALVDLIPLVADDSGVTVQENDDCVLFTSTLGTLYGKKATQQDLENYPVEDLIQSINESYDYEAIINRTLLVNALDRVNLFTGDYDSNSVTMTFSSDQVTLTTKRSNTHECIRYLAPSKVEEDFSIDIDAVFLKSQLLSSPKEDIKLKFGNEAGIQIICDKIVQLASSLADEEV